MNKYIYSLFFLAISSVNINISAKENINALIDQCSPQVHPVTMRALINVESSGNPLAIAIVRGPRLTKQPRSYSEAVQLVNQLTRSNANFSVGIAQINSSNFYKYAVNATDLLNPCKNLQISQKILQECYLLSKDKDIDKILSCYYSGNFTRGFKKDSHHTSYVERVYANQSKSRDKIFVPALKKTLDSSIKYSISKIEQDKEKNEYGQYAFDDFK